VREWTVVGQEQHAGRVAVEPPDRDHAHVPADEVDHRPPPARVARGRDRVPRLVEQHVAERLLADLAAVDTDGIRALDERVQLTAGAVHRHAPRLDQLVGGATRRDARACEVGIEPHSLILALPSRPCTTTPT